MTLLTSQHNEVCGVVVTDAPHRITATGTMADYGLGASIECGELSTIEPHTVSDWSDVEVEVEGRLEDDLAPGVFHSVTPAAGPLS